MRMLNKIRNISAQWEVKNYDWMPFVALMAEPSGKFDKVKDWNPGSWRAWC